MTAPLPTEIPSRQAVTFRLRNSSGSDRVAAQTGHLCVPFLIEQRQGTDYVQLPLRLPFECACECAPPGPAYADSYQIVPAGGSIDVTWDARALTECTALVDCVHEGWPGLSPTYVHDGALRPVTEGDYRVTIGFQSAPPPGCQAMGDSYFCPRDSPGSNPPLGEERLCRTAATASALFTLPTAGNLTVDVALP